MARAWQVLLALAGVVLGALSVFAQDGSVPTPGSPTVSTDEGITNNSYTNKVNVNFRISGSKPGFPAYGCKLDSQGFSTCLNPQTYTGLADGTHTLVVVFQRADGSRDIFPRAFTWTVDTKAPSLVMTSYPFKLTQPKTNQRSVSFTFDTQLASDKTGISFSCTLQRLTGGAPVTQSCNSKSVLYAGLGTTNQDTPYNLTVTATDRARNTKSIITSFWIDLLKPTLWIPALGRLPTTIPPRYTNNTLTTITFSSSETGQVAYQCRRDGGIFQTCSESDFSTTTYRSLPQGEHTFEIRATDWAGNLQTVFMLSRPVNYSNAFEVNTTTSVLQWRVDTTAPPKPQFVTRPPVQTNNVNPRFQFSLAGLQIGGVSFSCGLSKPGTNYLNFPCFPTTDVATPASPVPGTHNNKLSYGPHTLRVNAIDAAGNHGPSNFYTFTIDLKAPTVVFNTLNPQVPPGPINNSPTMTFNFHAVDVFPERTDAVNHFNDITRNPCPLYNCTMECRLLKRRTWTPCVSPITYTSITAANIRESHQFSVRARDNATNLGATTDFTWITDRIPPTPSWVTTPPKATNSSNATFTWKTTEPPSEPPSFRCRLDRQAWVNCTPAPAADGSYSWTLTKLSHHFNHLFEVEATDAFGNSAANLPYTWQVDLVDPTVTPDKNFATQGVVLGNPRILANNSHTNIQSVLFKFTSEAGATLTCNIDNTGYRPCTSFNQQTYSGLANGVHTFRVQAEDPVGRKTQLSQQPYFRWTVDTVPPVTRFLEVPNRYTNKLSASVAATANEPTTAFQCEYRSSQFQFGTTSWLPCSGPPFNARYTNNSIYVKLQQFTFSQTGVQINFTGNHVVNIRSTDLASNTGKATSFLWTVDLVAPKIVIPAQRTVQPDVFSADFRWRESPDATFYFSANEALVNYTCSLMPSLNWTNPHICRSPMTYNNITVADNYTFTVRALDAAGNYDPKQSRISYNWTADPFPPTTKVIDGPNYYLNRLTDLLFTLRVDVPRVSFMCTVYKMYVNGSVMRKGSWVPCVERKWTFGKPPSVSYSIRDVNKNYFNNTMNQKDVDGLYRFGAQASDVFNRTSDTAWYDFVIDTVEPNTALEGINPKATNMNWVSFSYFTTKQAYIHDRFECRLLRQNSFTLQFTECENSTYRCTWTECGRNTWIVNRVTGLTTAGVYRFEIRAVDKAGNKDMQPVFSQFIYQPTAPRVELVGVEPMNGTVASMNESLVYAFSGDEGISYTCYFSRSDMSGVNTTQNCKSPITYYPPPANARRNGSLSSFTVSGHDVSGNTKNVTFTRHLYNVSTRGQRLEKVQQRQIPKECTNNDTIFAYVAVVFWALFIITIIAFPCAILRKMESKTPMKRRESRQPLTSMGNPTFRSMEEEY